MNRPAFHYMRSFNPQNDDGCKERWAGS
jgi:hypothetical protein